MSSTSGGGHYKLESGEFIAKQATGSASSLR